MLMLRGVQPRVHAVNVCVCGGGSSGYGVYLLQTVLVKLLFESHTKLAVVVGRYFYSREEILLGTQAVVDGSGERSWRSVIQSSTPNNDRAKFGMSPKTARG